MIKITSDNMGKIIKQTEKLHQLTKAGTENAQKQVVFSKPKPSEHYNKIQYQVVFKSYFEEHIKEYWKELNASLYVYEEALELIDGLIVIQVRSLLNDVRRFPGYVTDRRFEAVIDHLNRIKAKLEVQEQCL